MAYIGNQVTTVPFITDTFSGNGAATSFGPLTRAPAGSASIAVYISGVYKTPGIDYTVSGTQITFAVAPASGTNNIVVLHLGSGSVAQVPSDGSVTAQKMAPDSVTSSALASSAVQANNILDGAITGPKIGLTSINANNVVDASLTGAKLAANTVTGDKLGQSSVSSNNILTNAVTNDKINSVANTKITGLIMSGQIDPSAIPASFPSGTLMLFQQTAAPTGWTKQTTHDNKALRVVSGAASSGGSVGFTTAFASQSVAGTVGSTTLTTTQIPSHTHDYYTGGGDGSNGAAGGAASNGRLTSATGGGQSHNHTFSGTAINLAVSYVDLIIASKD